MASIYVPITVVASVIKVDGVCYERVGPSAHEVTDTPDETFEDLIC